MSKKTVEWSGVKTVVMLLVAIPACLLLIVYVGFCCVWMPVRREEQRIAKRKEIARKWRPEEGKPPPWSGSDVAPIRGNGGTWYWWPKSGHPIYTSSDFTPGCWVFVPDSPKKEGQER